MVNTIREIRVSLEKPEQIQESDILVMLGKSNYEVSLRVLYERLQDYLEADFSLEFLVARLKQLVEQGEILVRESRGNSLYQRREVNSCTQEQKTCGVPLDSPFKFMWEESW